MVLPSHRASQVLSQRRLLKQQLGTGEEEKSRCSVPVLPFFLHTYLVAAFHLNCSRASIQRMLFPDS